MGNRILAGRYELTDMIGNGGMAVVYKAKDRLLNRYVAIKILKPAYSKDARFIENFRRESRAAASLSHPNIVSIFDVGWEGNINFIVMELVEGKTLADLIKEKGCLNPWDAVTYAKQLCAALSHAHEHQIIHRDVKPHNVLITSDNTAKLTDFGIAKAADMGTVVGGTGTVLGSVHYLSPEQARGGYVDEKTDIYSLGIVLYEMLTGKVPFDAENPVAVALMHVNDPIPSPRELVPEIPEEIEAIVMKATQKYPVNRFKTADEMLEALQNASLAAIGIIHTADGYEKAPDYEERAKDGELAESAIETNAPMDIRPRGKKTPAKYRKKDTGNDSAAENEEASPVRKGKKKGQKGSGLVKALSVVAVVLLAVILSFPLSKATSNLITTSSAPTEVTVPSLAGYTVEEATAILDELGLNLEKGTEVASYDYETGKIVSQTPKAENVVKTGNTVVVNISKGSLSGIIPNVVGQNLDAAEYLLQQDGYAVDKSIEYQYSTSVAEGKVIKQTPAADTKAQAGTKVSLVISKGKEDNTVSCPDIRLTDKVGANYALDMYGLKLGKIEYAPSDEVPEGMIISQDVDPQESVERGTSINVVMSSGPDDTGGGNVVDLEIDLTDSTKANFEISFKIIYDDGTTQDLPEEKVKKVDKVYELCLIHQGKSATVVVFYDGNRQKEASVDFEEGTYEWD